jgi:DNA-binding CsgD family transcriptional regulator
LEKPNVGLNSNYANTLTLGYSFLRFICDIGQVQYFLLVNFYHYAFIPMMEYFRKRSDFSHPAMRLSNWKKKIFMMLPNGYSHRRIAEELKLSIATVQSYLKNVYEQMHVHSQTQAVAKYLSIQGRWAFHRMNQVKT